DGELVGPYGGPTDTDAGQQAPVACGRRDQIGLDPNPVVHDVQIRRDRCRNGLPGETVERAVGVEHEARGEAVVDLEVGSGPRVLELVQLLSRNGDSALAFERD